MLKGVKKISMWELSVLENVCLYLKKPGLHLLTAIALIKLRNSVLLWISSLKALEVCLLQVS